MFTSTKQKKMIKIIMELLTEFLIRLFLLSTETSFE